MPDRELFVSIVQPPFNDRGYKTTPGRLKSYTPSPLLLTPPFCTSSFTPNCAVVLAFPISSVPKDQGRARRTNYQNAPASLLLNRASYTQPLSHHSLLSFQGLLKTLYSQVYWLDVLAFDAFYPARNLYRGINLALKATSPSARPSAFRKETPSFSSTYILTRFSSCPSRRKAGNDGYD